MGWVKISKAEFQKIKDRSELFGTGLSLSETFTDMYENYAFTIWRDRHGDIIKTIHNNGVENEPDFFVDENFYCGFKDK